MCPSVEEIYTRSQATTVGISGKVAAGKEVLYLHRGALTLIFGPFGADVVGAGPYTETIGPAADNKEVISEAKA